MERKRNKTTNKSTNTTKRKPATKKAGGKAVEQEVAVGSKKPIIMLATALLMFFIVIIPGENVWLWVHNLFLGLFGIWAILWPILLAYVGVIIALEKSVQKFRTRLWLTIVTILIVCTAAYIYTDPVFTEGTNFFDFTYQLFAMGTQAGGAGVVGGFIGEPIMLALGTLGARIIITIFLIADVMILTGITVKQVLKMAKKPVNMVSDSVKHAREKKVERKERERASYLEDSEFVIPDEQVKKSRKKRGNESLENLNRAFGLKNEEQYEKEEKVPKTEANDFLNGGFNINFGVDENEPNYEKQVKAEAKEVLPKESANEFRSDVTRKEVKITSSTSIPIDSSQEALDTASKLAQDFIKKREENEKEQLANSAQMALYEEQKSMANTYVFPPISMLQAGQKVNVEIEREELQTNGQKLVDTLKSFGVQTKIIDICRGPSVTRYELQPAAGVKISKITNLADDLALNLAATGVRIEAPIPGKPAVGIEIPNKNKSVVRMRELLESNAFLAAKSKLTVVLGKDIAGQVTVADLAKMPHMLIAGTTGSGKSVCINSLIMSLIYKSSPDEVRFLMIDPKVVELGIYNGIPHLLVPVVTEPRKAAGALNWAVTEMLNRYKMFADFSVKDLNGYNELAKFNGYVDENGQPMLKMPQIVIIIDELADLMMAAPNEVEDSICRLAQMARAAGMHLVVATQRPTVDVVTGLIKANIPSRIAFAVSSAIDSRTILDSVGAEKLLGQGDMLFSPVGMHKPTRIQGCFVTEKEIEAVVDFVKNSREISYDEKIIEDIEKNAIVETTKGDKTESDGNVDPMLDDAIKCVIEAGQASTSLLQRRLRLGYARAGRLVDEMEQMGIVGPHEGSKPRQVLMSYSQWLERNMQKTENTDTSDGME